MAARTHEGGDAAPARRGGAGKLWVVSATLGNPEDLSPRARSILAEADVILAEDTRSARRILSQAGAQRPDQVVLSCFDANEAARAADAVARITAGQNVALLSEAGTPLVSDPGFRVVTAVIEAGLVVQPIPGPSALLAALVGSGQSPTGSPSWAFRRERVAPAAACSRVCVCILSPCCSTSRLCARATPWMIWLPCWATIARACVARELTKTHEEFVRGTLAQLRDRYRVDRPLGEITLVVAGADPVPPMRTQG